MTAHGIYCGLGSLPLIHGVRSSPSAAMRQLSRPKSITSYRSGSGQTCGSNGRICKARANLATRKKRGGRIMGINRDQPVNGRGRVYLQTQPLETVRQQQRRKD